MNGYKFDDYGIFNDAVKTTSTLKDSYISSKNDIDTVKTTINNDSVFMGPIADECRTEVNNICTDLEVINDNFSMIQDYLVSTSENYKVSDNNASSVINNSNSNNSNNSSSNNTLSINTNTFSNKPNFANQEAYGTGNEIARDNSSWIGECSWFSIGKFTEMYGYKPNVDAAHRYGYEMASNIANNNDNFVLSSTPKSGAIFSCPQGPYATSPLGHTGVVTNVNGNTVTIQESNVSGMSNTEYYNVNGQSVSYLERTMTIDELKAWYPGITFANPK